MQENVNTDKPSKTQRHANLSPELISNLHHLHKVMQLQLEVVSRVSFWNRGANNL